jgi:ankyrin repeat protein
MKNLRRSNSFRTSALIGLILGLISQQVDAKSSKTELNFANLVGKTEISSQKIKTKSPTKRACRMDDLQSCKSCSSLKASISSEGLSDGEYYRGALWNPLYAAFVNNCISIGKQLLDAGVNPNAGGEFGLFLLSLTQAWPHNDKKTNATWRSLVISHGANLDWISPISHKSARQIIAEKGLLPNYPDFVE